MSPATQLNPPDAETPPDHRTLTPRRPLRIITAAALAAGAALFAPITAQADPIHHVTGTGSDGLIMHAGPGFSGEFLTVLPEGQELDVACYSLSDEVYGNPVWLQVSSDLGSGYVSDLYTDTAWSTLSDLGAQGIGDCSSARPEPAPQPPVAHIYDGFFNRQAAADWASMHFDDDERFPKEDCTWFASQALWAGGLPKSADWTDFTLDPFKVASRKQWPGPTNNAVLANGLVDYLVSSGLADKEQITWSDNTAGGAREGDLIAYDWDNGADGLIDHLSVVVSLDADGHPTIAQHTPRRSDRYWSWDIENNNWIEYTQKGNGLEHSAEPEAWLIHIQY